jgi:nitroreductase
MTVCPADCVTVTGRDLSPSDLLELPRSDASAGYTALYSLLVARRSVREYRDQVVPPEVINQITRAASTAPMGIPPSEVGVLVFAGRDKVQAFRNELLRELEGMRWMFSPAALWLMRPFMSRESYRSLKAFVVPVIDAYVEYDRQGVDAFFYRAPVALYWYGSPYADPADPYIAATYAMLAAESLGLGSCLLGFPGYAIKYSRRLKSKYGLPRRLQPGIVMVLGYPAFRHARAIRRRFAEAREV